MTQKKKARCCVWDFTLSEEKAPQQWQVSKTLTEHCKKWCYQLEQGEQTGYRHFQGRINLKSKQLLTGVKKIFGTANWTPTSNENRNNNFYVTKDDTRIQGPWKDNDPKITREVREMKVLPWQQKIIDSSSNYEKRIINFIYDERGGVGKTDLGRYLDQKQLGIYLPPMKEIKDVMRNIMARPPSNMYMIDIPRGLHQNKLAELYAGAETIKNGYCYDDRYHWRNRWQDCPQVWIFANELPNWSWLSIDRWKCWIIEKGEMIHVSIANLRRSKAPITLKDSKSFID